MIKKDFIFWLILIYSLGMLLLNLVCIAIGVWQMVELYSYNILSITQLKPYAISLICLDGLYLAILVLYLVLRRKK